MSMRIPRIGGHRNGSVGGVGPVIMPYHTDQRTEQNGNIEKSIDESCHFCQLS